MATDEETSLARLVADLRPLVKRHARIIGLAAALAFFLSSLVAWRLVFDPWHRSRIYRDVASARDLLANDEIVKTDVPPRDSETHPRRPPELLGEVYYLHGTVNNALADQSATDLERQFHLTGLAFFREAARHGVPARDEPDLLGQLGRGYHVDQAYAQAIEPLLDALKFRRLDQAVILRRLANIAVLRDPADPDEMTGLVERWASVPDVPLWMSNLATQCRNTMIADDVDFTERRRRLRELMARQVQPEQTRPLTPTTAEIDATAESLIADSKLQDASAYLGRQLQDNTAQLSFILRPLADSYAKKTPSDVQSALTYAGQRLALWELEQDEIDDAKYQMAGYYLAAGQPLLARKLVEPLLSPRVPTRHPELILARSYYDEATELQAMSTQAWEKKTPALAQYSQMLNDIVRPASSPSWPHGSNVSEWQSSLMQAIGPDRLKDVLTSAKYLKAAQYLAEWTGRNEFQDERLLADALLTLGRGYRALRKFDEAERSFQQVVTTFPESDGEIAARFLRADTMRAAGSPAALDAFAEAASASEARGPYRNDFLPANELREVFENAWLQYANTGRHEDAMRLATYYVPFSQRGRADELYADAATSRARELLAQAETISDDASRDASDQARTLLSRAGHYYFQVAETRRESAQYADLVWQSALSFFEGHAYPLAIETLTEFLRVHTAGDRSFEAEFLLARSYMAESEFETARTILETALDRGTRSPFRFEGRLRLAQCYMELRPAAGSAVGDVPTTGETASPRKQMFFKAEKVLRENVDGLNLNLDPSAEAWRQSLFTLGRLYYDDAQYDKAISVLREATRRYPEDRDVVDSKFRLADAYFLSSKEPGRLADSEQAPRRRAAYERDKDVRLRAALDQFRRLIDELRELQGQRNLSPGEALVMQSSLLRIAECLFDLEEWENAQHAYSTVANLYDGRAISLIAYIEIANSYWNLDKASEARATLRQALASVERMSDSAFEDSALTKAEWTDRLKQLVGDL